MAALSFTGTNALGKQHFPDNATDTLPSTTWRTRKLNIPEGATKIAVRFEDVAGRVSFLQTLVDDTAGSVLSATTGVPVDMNVWTMFDVGEGEACASRIPAMFLASATGSARFYVIAFGAAEPKR
jgi:hypothetical protein